nr:MAG TPA: hypothetical protein [Caudoviricetes sp.]
MLKDKQTGELFNTFTKAHEYAKINYDYGDDTSAVKFVDIFELTEV